MELNKLYHGLSYEEYNAAPGLRAGELKQMLRSPAHMIAARQAPREPSEELEFGKILHAAVENGEKFLEMYVVPPIFTGKTKDGKESTRSKEALEKKAAWYAELKPDAIVVQQDWVDPLKGMLKALTTHRFTRNLFKNGARETSLWVEDDRTGVVLKCRPDFFTEDGFLVDVKTTRNAHDSKWIGQYGHIFNPNGYFYALQMAHYAHCLKLAGVAKSDSATIVAIEKEPPYGIKIYPLDTALLEQGDTWRRKLTKIYSECLKTGVWPGYPEEAVAIVLPQYVEMPEIGPEEAI